MALISFIMMLEHGLQGGLEMKKLNRRFLISLTGGILLLVVGVLLLLSNLGIVTLELESVIGPLLAGGGLIFLLVFITNTDAWWALIPGFTLIGVGINAFVSPWLGENEGSVTSAIFLGSVGLPFLLIYISNHRHWWALLPGGVLLSIAVTQLIPDSPALIGGIFFLGLAITFGLLYLLPTPSGKLKWALYPAGILLLIGIFITLGATNLLAFVGPLVLLAFGVYVIVRALRK
jgi:hypothetical protein